MAVEIGALVAAGAAQHRGRAVGGRFGGLSLPADAASAAGCFTAQHPAFAFAAQPQQQFAGAKNRKCPRCPLLGDGTPTLHPSGFKCESSCLCLVCNSDRHLEHGCFIKHGVPLTVKLNATMMVEVVRLNALFKEGKFDSQQPYTCCIALETKGKDERTRAPQADRNTAERGDAPLT